MNPIVEAAIHAFEQGWSPIPIVEGAKRPAHSDWTNTKYKTRKELEDSFTGYSIGLLLGDKSNGLIDIDLDSYYSRKLADGFLPATRMIHGRDSSPRSHYWYHVKDWSVTTRKFADPTDDEALVEIRGTGGQSLIPPSIHPSGEQYEWLGEWHPPTTVSYIEIEKQVRWLAAAALLAKHWPDKGQRHDAALALAGGILNLDNEELKKDAEAFVASVALCAGDEEGFERQQDVSTTRVKVEKGKKVKGWPSLAKIIGSKKVVRQAMDWLSYKEEVIEDEVTGLTRNPLDLTEMPPPRPMLMEDLIYAGKTTWIQGEPGMGKSIFVLWMCIHLIRDGHTVMFLDEDGSVVDTTERLIRLGMTNEEAQRGFWYYQEPHLNAGIPEERDRFFEEFEKANPSLVVLDPLSDFLGMAGLSENDNIDVTRFVKGFIEPIKRRGTAILIIDHMSKDNPLSNYARGAGAKKAKTDAAWTYTATKEFDQTTIGRISLKRAKDRFGALPQTHTFKMGGHEEKIIIEPSDLVRFMGEWENPYCRRIFEWLKEHAYTEEDAVQTQEIYDAIKGSKNEIIKAIKAIQADVDSSPLTIIEDGSSKLYYYAGDTTIDWASV